MGKGDKKTRRGKIIMGTSGKLRPRKKKAAVIIKTKKKTKTKTKTKKKTKK
jgi:30S ribosomal protein S31